MKQRIALWALAGFIVACGWAAYARATFPAPWTSERTLRTIIEITCPPSLLGQIVPLPYYWAILINAVTYALLGLGIELLRRIPATRLSN